MAAMTLDISEARKQLNSLDQRLTSDQPVIFITRHNKKAFVAVNLDYFSAIMETIEVLSDPQALEMLRESLADIRAGRLVDHEELPASWGKEADE